jgi:dephospho-CoA kinase
MNVVGLTGKACAGKNQVALGFEKKGYRVIDVDKLGHKALEFKKNEIIKAFGSNIISGGLVDRKKLGDIVFSSKAQLRLLEAIVHPYVKKLCLEIIKESETDVVLNAAVLQRGALLELCSNVIFVKASFCIRYKRSLKRDKKSFKWFVKREFSQKDVNIRELKKKTQVFVIVNQKGTKEIYRQIDRYCGIFKK